jgi:hypothetical protein
MGPARSEGRRRTSIASMFGRNCSGIGTDHLKDHRERDETRESAGYRQSSYPRRSGEGY